MRPRPAGDFDYERAGSGYARQRRADPRIAAAIHAALGKAETVLNVGAGAGSYEPSDRHVTAVEPSASMRAQRPPGLRPAIDATAEDLPFEDGSFDAVMAMVTVHQWPDWREGIRELCRVGRGPVVILSFDGTALGRLWIGDYVPELFEAESARYPAIGDLCASLGERASVHEVPIPIDCIDGFTEAYYARPEAFLDPLVRRSQSAWGFVDPVAVSRGIERLRSDLQTGRWDERYGTLRTQPEFIGALRLIVGRPEPAR